MFIAALILVLSVAAFGQFALFYWRALLISTAAEPVSENLQQSVGYLNCELGAGDFQTLLALRDIFPDLSASKENWGGVRIYNSLLGALHKIMPVPAVAEWIVSEQSLCSRYAAVLLDRRLRANTAYRLSLNHQ